MRWCLSGALVRGASVVPQRCLTSPHYLLAARVRAPLPLGRPGLHCSGSWLRRALEASRRRSGAQWEATAADILGSVTECSLRLLSCQCLYSTPRRRPRPSQGSMPTLTLDAISSLPSTPHARARAAVASYSSRWQPSRRSAPHCRITAEDPRTTRDHLWTSRSVCSAPGVSQVLMTQPVVLSWCKSF